jgi:Fe-Mn family superoxide dismutase
MRFEPHGLSYDLNALEPYISTRTLELHHNRHLLTYIKNLNTLVERTKFDNTDLETIIRVSDGPIFNNASQVWNHLFYFDNLTPLEVQEPRGTFAEAVRKSFGSMAFLRDMFIRNAVSLFGAGWIWLAIDAKGSLEILQESNAGNPLRRGFIPLLACDVWEHAYYLDYHDNRSQYVEAFWNLVNWEIIEKRYNAATI